MRLTVLRRRSLRFQPLELRLVRAGQTLVDTGVLDLIEGNDNAAAQITSSLLHPNSGISVVDGSFRFEGRIGDGVDRNTAQSAIFSGTANGPFQLTSLGSSQPTIVFPTKGVLLTSGIANLPAQNSSARFDYRSFGVTKPDKGTADDKNLIQSFFPESQVTEINDVNLVEFQFTVADGKNAIEADFVFGSDEFDEQSVTDIFVFVVDGSNYAYFPDGSLVSFDKDQNALNFSNNIDGTFGIEYDGISNRLHVTGRLSSAIPTGGVHKLQIAVANTSDDEWDSGAFIGNLQATTSDSTGIGSTISGAVFDDVDGDGVVDQGEHGIPNVTVTLERTDNASSATPFVRHATSDQNGKFSFTGLAEGIYRLVESQPSGFSDGIDSPHSSVGRSVERDTIVDIVVGPNADLDEYTFGEAQVQVQVVDGDTDNETTPLLPRETVLPGNPPIEPQTTPQKETLLVVTFRRTETPKFAADFGTGGEVRQATRINLAASATPEAVDAFLSNEELRESPVFASFLDFVDPEMLVVDLGDEPPAKIASDESKPTDGANAAKQETDSNRRKERVTTGDGASSTAHEVTYMKPVQDSNGATEVSRPLTATSRLSSASNWKWFATAATIFLVGAVGWRRRLTWIEAARKLRSR